MSDTTAIEWTDEMWKPIQDWPGFTVSSEGRLVGPSGQPLKPSVSKDGHLYIVRRGRDRSKKLWVHRAVLLAFVGECPCGHESRHLDGDPGNNEAGNLAWGTRLENMRDKQRHGTEAHGENKPGVRLTVAEARAIRVDRRSSRIIAAEYSVSHTTVLRIRRGDRWRVA